MKCGRCGVEVVSEVAHRGVCAMRFDGLSREEDERGLVSMTKEEALGEASRLIRDADVPANQKGPLLAVLARVAGWETAPEYDFEKVRAKWMVSFERMLREDVTERERLETVLKGSPVLVELGEMVERMKNGPA